MTHLPPSDTDWILPLDSAEAVLPRVGGKGANLARLVRAGFPVPGGFLITTQAYEAFVAANQLEARILSLLDAHDLNDPDGLEQASRQIRESFSAGRMPDALSGALRAAYRAFGEKAAAVRSSATAEDLPDMSFAGQQDTYLNVIGSSSLLKAVVDCWSSLWTARAIGYRTRNRVPHAGAALAVVVQEMVESQTSGVMFTANPLTGLRSETVINAAPGLGELLVSGKVVPDYYVVDSEQGVILSKTLGAKAISIHSDPEGGTRITEQDRSGVQALPDVQIMALAHLGRQVDVHYDFPQDIEWAWANDTLYVLQSRPVTSLFPLPDGLLSEPLKVLFSFAAIQGMNDPITPLGYNTIGLIFSAGASLFGIRVTPQTQTIFYGAGGRIWIDFTSMLRNSVGRRILPAGLSLIEPTIRQAVEEIADDPRLQPTRQGISWKARARIARFALPLFAHILLNFIAPQRRRERIVRHSECVLAQMEERCKAVKGDLWEKLAQQADLLPDLAAEHLPHTFRLFVSGLGVGMASWNFLNRLAAHAQSPEAASELIGLVLQMTRGMPHNPTTEMDLTLWEMAKAIRRDEASWQVFKGSSAQELAARFHAGTLPEHSAVLITAFLEKYGGRGLGEIDLGRTRWADDPTHVFEMLGSFLQIEDETMAPDVVFARGVDLAEEAALQLVDAVRHTRGGWFKARAARFLTGRMRQLMGLRERPKFFAVRLMWMVHRELLKTGREFVDAGELNSPDDLFYLSFAEQKAFAAREERDWPGLIASRREAYQREMLRRQIPRLLLSDGRAFYEGISAPDDTEGIITGSPVSPGTTEGRVRVVLDPRHANLQPGEIMVCPGTDPSWTPLFLSAAGLVMETGGMMTHGAVVAREYGIPAIVGVDHATQRLQTGQLIQVNGSSGQILILEDVPQ